MKILVTGGAGFIGSAVVRLIINETNYDVVNLDKLTYAGNLESLPYAANTQCFFAATGASQAKRAGLHDDGSVVAQTLGSGGILRGKSPEK